MRKKKHGILCAWHRQSKKNMSIGVCVRMDEWEVTVFTLSLPLFIMMLSFVMRVDDALRKEMDFLEPCEGQSDFSDDM